MSEQDPLLPVQDGGQQGFKVRQSIRTWRTKTAHLLESRTLHQTVITLTLIDATCAFVDLAYTLLSPSCTPTGPDAPLWLDVLAYVSLTINTFFLVEVPLSLWAFGFEYYDPFGDVVHSSLHLFDAFIVITTFVLEVGLKGRVKELAALLVIFRLWRIVKLAGGIAVGAGEIEEEVANELKSTKQELESVKHQLNIVQEDNWKLRHRIASMGGDSEL